MYIRFITKYKDELQETNTGVFQALGYLIRSEATFQYDKEKLEEIRNWFNSNLEKPNRFNKHSNQHKSNIAISWFKDSASSHLAKMYDLIPIFQNYNLNIDIIKKENPGYKVFEDEYQVVTIPHNKEKSSVI